MFAGVLRAGLTAVIAGAMGLPMVPTAHADIFTWIDAHGTINVSNIAPPDGVRVTGVVRENPEKAKEAEVQALAARVRQLEDEVAAAKSQAPQVVYQPVPTPPSLPAMQYAADWAPPPSSYAYSAEPPASVGCDYTWMNCGQWWGAGIYPASVVVLRSPKFRRFPPVRVEHHIVSHQPIASHQPAGPRQGVHRG
jgi:hypothetical protein